jgi:hypothetical protein
VESHSKPILLLDFVEIYPGSTEKVRWGLGTVFKLRKAEKQIFSLRFVKPTNVA